MDVAVELDVMAEDDAVELLIPEGVVILVLVLDDV